MKPNRSELIRILTLAEQGKLTTQDLLGDTPKEVRVTMNLNPDPNDYPSEHEIALMQRRGNVFVTLNLA